MFRTGVVLRELHLFPADDVDDGHAFRQFGGGLHRVRKAAHNALFDHQSVDDDLNIVLIGLFQFDVFRKVSYFPVDACPNEAGLGSIFQGLGKSPLLSPRDGRHDLDAGAFRQCHDLVDDLVHGLVLDLSAADGTVGHADAGVHETHIVIDLRQSPHRGAGVLGGSLLIDGNGRRESVNGLHLRFVHNPQELTGIGGKRLHIAPLTLGKNGVEGKGRLPRTGETGEDHHFLSRNMETDILQIVFACSDDADLFICHRIMDPFVSFLSCRQPRLWESPPAVRRSCRGSKQRSRSPGCGRPPASPWSSSE